MRPVPRPDRAARDRDPDRDGIPPWTDALAEFVGTAVLVTVALSSAVLLTAPLSPAHHLVGPGAPVRLVIGTLSVATAAAVVYSPLGRRSGGHLNPAITIGFLGLRKFRWQGAAAYVASQLAGAVAGAALVALTFGRWASGIRFSASVPGRPGPAAAFAAELVATFALASVVFHFVDRPRVMRFTPVAAAVTTVVVILVEAPVSTTSLNPARSFGPAVLSLSFAHLWVYLLAPPAGAALAAVAFSSTRGPVACAKLVHRDDYECHFRSCSYRAAQAPGPSEGDLG
ncbi:MAG: aquaporin [Acidobacteriota bacterium]|nr:aquaporin [Acidobacteriota bacterium]